MKPIHQNLTYAIRRKLYKHFELKLPSSIVSKMYLTTAQQSNTATFTTIPSKVVKMINAVLHMKRPLNAMSKIIAVICVNMADATSIMKT